MPPNILLITSDQHRADCLGVAGHPCVRTPHLDKLAAAGVRFSNAYADCPVCIPQRTTLVTGIKSHTYGEPRYSETYRIPRDRRDFLGSLITEAGYQTCIVGKTHWHTDPSFRGGFETVISHELLGVEIARRCGRPGSHFTGLGWNELNPTASLLPPELYSTDWLVDRALDFLRFRDRTQPLFLWLSLTDPHPPNVIHEPYYSMYDRSPIPEPILPAWADDDGCPLAIRRHREGYNGPRMRADELRKARGVYYGKITNLDHQIGRLLGQLAAGGQLRNTTIVYASDHGEMLGDCGDMAKSSFIDASARVPLIVRPAADAAVEPGRTIDALVCLDDLLPTLCGIAGARVPDDITGKSWQPLLRGETGSLHDFQHGQIENSHMFHDGRLKYLYFVEDGSELLFDTVADPCDETDLSGDESLCGPIR